MKRRVLIVDDERLARVALKKILSAQEDVEVVGEAKSVGEAAELVAELKPDIVFLDIELPDGLGFDLFNRVDIRAHVIFVTAYNQHALRAFEVNALDYIVKPVDPAHIKRALERTVVSAAAQPKKEEERGQGPSLELDDTVCLQESKSMKFTRVREIVFISAADDYVEVHLSSGYTALVNERLVKWESLLPAEFVRTHRSTLVNIDFIEEIDRSDGAWTIRLRGRSEKLGMSRRYAQALKKSLHFVG